MVSTLRCDLRSHLSVQEISVEESISRRGAGFQRLLRGGHWESGAGVTWLGQGSCAAIGVTATAPARSRLTPSQLKTGAGRRSVLGATNLLHF
jgi:hypothetical protein